jgi:predicted MFS family arabinose efflux permease
MWLSKPVYEALPYYYAGLGLSALVVRLFVDYWHWPAICTVVGIASLAAGVFVWVKRRGHRSRPG